MQRDTQCRAPNTLVYLLVGLSSLALCGCALSVAPPIDNRDERVNLADKPPVEPVYTLRDPVIETEVPADVRDLERRRRAQRPTDQNRKTFGLTYDEVRKKSHEDGPHKSAEPMPSTSCRSVEPVPKGADAFSGPYRVHDLAVSQFENASGFGFVRMRVFQDDRGIQVASGAIDRVELVSLLTDTDPSVYILDEMATPSLTRQAKRRPLDEFERLGLDAVRRGEHLVWTLEAPTRMFGAIRARTYCLECHASAKKGDLLGAFSYYLNTPVDQLTKRHTE